MLVLSLPGTGLRRDPTILLQQQLAAIVVHPATIIAQAFRDRAGAQAVTTIALKIASSSGVSCQLLLLLLR